VQIRQWNQQLKHHSALGDARVVLHIDQHEMMQNETLDLISRDQDARPPLLVLLLYYPAIRSPPPGDLAVGAHDSKQALHVLYFEGESFVLVRLVGASSGAAEIWEKWKSTAVMNR
jgi:hypothetical protein